MANNLIVYNASAGSGKTFILAIEYIALCLSTEEERFFRRILAITFTNKAAHELKGRIIQFLADLAEAEPDPTKVHELQKRLPLSSQEISDRAGRVHRAMLYNYGEIHVSTIDSFVLSILRAFSKELGMAFDFDIELDNSRVKDLLVESILSEVGRDQFITEQLARMVTQNLDDGRSWNPKRDMKEAIDLLMDEESIPYRESLAEEGEASLVDQLRTLEAERNSLWSQIKKDQKVVREGMEERGLTPSSFARGSTGFISFAFKDLRKQNPPTASQVEMIAQGNFASTNAKKNGLEDIVVDFSTQIITPCFQSVMTALSNVTLKDNLYSNRLSLILALRLQNLLKTFEQKEGTSVIKDNNHKIAAIIDNNPTPFIYERVGERYRHFLIDEFQDTSLLQWRNMLPLIDGSLAYGRKNFLVGDVKQSIYRWRGGEADQMIDLPKVSNSADNHVLQQIEENLSSNLDVRTLANNFRSATSVISFNNDLFQYLGTSISEKYRHSYASARQGEQRSDIGYVEIKALPIPLELEDSFEPMLASIRKSERDGYSGSDICILTRSNRHGQLISKFLEQNNYSVSSPDSLLLNGHADVQLLMCFLLILSSSNALEAELFITHRLLEISERTDSFHRYASQSNNGRSSSERVQRLCTDLGYDWSLNNYTDKDVFYCLNLLCADLHLDINDAYIHELLNAALSYIQSMDSTFLGFYEYWKKNQKSMAVKAGANRNSIQLMTIHKSKGLQFPVVVIPYLNWTSGKNTKKKEWTQLEHEALDIGLLSINKSLTDTPYEHLLNQEEDKTQLDDLNLLYVAFTRAEDRMYVQVADPKKKGLAKTILAYIKDNSSDETKFILGEETTRQNQPSASKSSENLVDYSQRARSETLSLALSRDQNSTRQLAVGQILHYILEKSEDLRTATAMLSTLQNKRELTQDEESQILESLQRVYSIEELQGWNKNHTIHKEIEVISPSGKLYRIDKLLIDEEAKKVVIVDYKSGQEDHKHKEQVQGYLNLLENMEWHSTEGYLLYTSSGKLEKV